MQRTINVREARSLRCHCRASQTGAAWRTGAQVAEEPGCCRPGSAGQLQPGDCRVRHRHHPGPGNHDPGRPDPGRRHRRRRRCRSVRRPRHHAGNPDHYADAGRRSSAQRIRHDSGQRASGTPNADAILQVANWQAGRDPVTNISRIVAGMAGDPSETRITRPPGIAPVVWETFVRDAQTGNRDHAAA